MCSNYQPSRTDALEAHFNVAPPDGDYKPETYPTYIAPIIRRPGPNAGKGERSCALAMFGLLPHWAKPDLAKHTYNARTETVAEKPSFRHAFKKAQFCIIPAASIFEPCYETGKAVRWKVAGDDDKHLGIAGIWEEKIDDTTGLLLLSFSMLTINADDHPVMRRMHRPGDEKRMLVFLPFEQYDDWLHCKPSEAPDYFRPYPAELLTAHAAPKVAN